MSSCCSSCSKSGTVNAERSSPSICLQCRNNNNNNNNIWFSCFPWVFFPWKFIIIQTMQNTLREWERAAPLCALQPFHLLPQFNNFTSQELQRKKHGNGWKKRKKNTQKQAALEILPQIPNLSMQVVWKLCVCVCVWERERERERVSKQALQRKEKRKKAYQQQCINCKEKLNAAEGPKTLTSLLLPPVCTPSGHLLYLSRISRILLDDLIITDNAKGQKKKRKEKTPPKEWISKELSHLENFIIKLQIQKSQKIKARAHFWTILQICCQLASHNQQQLLLMLIEAWAF